MIFVAKISDFAGNKMHIYLKYVGNHTNQYLELLSCPFNNIRQIHTGSVQKILQNTM